MTSGSPWSVKGIDPKAREIAKDLARRSGMTLGEWMNTVIYDDNANTPEGAPSQRAAVAGQQTRPTSENQKPRRSGDDLERVLASIDELTQRFDAAAREQSATSARFEAAIADLKSDQARVAERLQVAEQSGGGVPDGKAATLRALETALNKVAGHLATGEQRHLDSMAEMRKELGEEMVRVAEQVNRKVLEVEDRSADAIAQVGAEVSRVAASVDQRMRRADDAQAEALEKLGGEIARITERLSDRIAAAERRAAQSVEDVGQQVARVTDRIHQRQERSESELGIRMRQSEERTAKLLEEARQTIERRLGRVLGQDPEPARVEAPQAVHTVSEPEAVVELEAAPEAAVAPQPEANPFAELWKAVEAGADEVEAGDPVAEPAHHDAIHAASADAEAYAVETDHAETLHADTVGSAPAPVFLEPPSFVRDTEFATDAEDLDVEIASAESIEEDGLSAETILEAGGLDSEDLETDGLAELLAGEEEIDLEPQSDPEPQAAHTQEEHVRPRLMPFQAYTPTLTARATYTPPEDIEALDAVAEAINQPEDHLEDDLDIQAEAAPHGETDLSAEAEEPKASCEFRAIEPEDAHAEHLDAERIDDDHLHAEVEDDHMFAAPPAAEHPVFASEALNADGDDEQLRPSTMELIAQAKAAAFTEGAYRPRSVEAPAEEEIAEAEEPIVPAYAEPRPAKARANSSMRTMLMAGATVGFVGLAGVGYVTLKPELMRRTAATPAKPIPVGPASHPLAAAAPATAPAPAQAAVALAAAPTPKDTATDLEAMYRDAAAKVDANDPTGVAPLRTAANLGYAPAQRRLGKLYEDGGPGVEKDAAEGRRWTQRAAVNGDARAMHNLGLDYYEGIGGPKSLPVAANWFQKAAELGLRDSQYNLARFMEAGVGVPQNLQGAYRWYLIAARAGDTEAQTRADSLKAKLPATQVTAAQALANAFRPDPAAAPASLKAMLQGNSPKQLALAQRALNKLGYFKGDDDGVPSQALGEAIQAYQRQRGLASNGQLSPELIQTFAHITQ